MRSPTRKTQTIEPEEVAYTNRSSSRRQYCQNQRKYHADMVTGRIMHSKVVINLDLGWSVRDILPLTVALVYRNGKSRGESKTPMKASEQTERTRRY